MKRRPSNLAASVHHRLLRMARATARPFDELLQYFAMERFLYRLSRSSHAQRFTLKGALMLAAWNVSLARSTKDVDLLGHVANDMDDIVSAFKDICGQEVDADGVVFDVDSVVGERIAEDAEYEGVRARLRSRLGNARLSLQVDVGFGDAVVPGPVAVAYPTLLDFPAPHIRGYTQESSVAEKFHAMVVRGLLNSRLRDYFDIWALSRQFDFEGPVLSRAVRATFSRRQTAVPEDPPGLSDDFGEDRARIAQYRGFLRRNRMTSIRTDLRDVVQAVSTFLGPVAQALHRGRELQRHWRAPGPWT